MRRKKGPAEPGVNGYPDDLPPHPIPVEMILRRPEVRQAFTTLGFAVGWPVESVAHALDLLRCLLVPPDTAVTQLLAAASYGYRAETFVELLETIYANLDELGPEGGVFSLSDGQNFMYEKIDGETDS